MGGTTLDAVPIFEAVLAGRVALYLSLTKALAQDQIRQITRFDIDGVFHFMAGAALLLALVSSARSAMTAAPLHLERPFGILAPQAAPLAHDALESTERSVVGPDTAWADPQRR